jgi:hypothetical protein
MIVNNKDVKILKHMWMFMTRRNIGGNKQKKKLREDRATESEREKEKEKPVLFLILLPHFVNELSNLYVLRT